MKGARRFRLNRRLDELRRRRLTGAGPEPPPWVRLLAWLVAGWRRWKGGAR